MDAEYDGGGDVSEQSAGSAEMEGAADAGGDGAARDGQQAMIVTGSLYMTVEDPIETADQAVDIVQGAGGRIDGRNETAADEYDGGSASLVLRIPENQLEAVVDDLRELGTVDQLETSARDVTAEVTDLESTISTLRASTERIQALLSQAEDIKDIIALEDELAGRQGQLQSLEAQQRGLGDQVSLATIELSLTTEPVVVVDEDSPSNFWDGLVSGWNALVGFLSAALVVFGVLLPWLAVMALIAFAVVFAVRARTSRKPRPVHAGAVPPASQPPTTQPYPTPPPADSAPKD